MTKGKRAHLLGLAERMVHRSRRIARDEALIRAGQEVVYRGLDLGTSEWTVRYVVENRAGVMHVHSVELIATSSPASR